MGLDIVELVMALSTRTRDVRSFPEPLRWAMITTMFRRPGVVVLLALGVPSLAAQVAGKALEVRPEPENVVASRLLGQWRLDEELTKRLGGSGVASRLVFNDDKKVLAAVPARIADKLQSMRIYVAGTMVRGDAEHAFLLTERSGNASLVWFRERNGDPMGDAESFNLMLVRAAAAESDLLFVGGDSNNQPFSAYVRDTRGMAILQPAAAVAEMMRLLEAGKQLDFVRDYCLPADLEDLVRNGGSVEKLAKELEEGRRQKILEALQRTVKVEPTMNEAGDEATWEFDTNPGKLRLKRVGKRWYLCNH